MPVTQQDVAEAARVSVSTVCLVLRDDPRISERTRRRVLQAAQDLGYVARTALHAPGGVHHLGVLIAEGSAHPSADHFFGEVLRGVTEEAEQGGHTVSVAAFDGHDLPRLVREGRAHGLILGGNPISEGVLERVRAGEADPACPRCGGMLKSDTISFGQALVPEVIDRALAAAGVPVRTPLS